MLQIIAKKWSRKISIQILSLTNKRIIKTFYAYFIHCSLVKIVKGFRIENKISLLLIYDEKLDY